MPATSFYNLDRQAIRSYLLDSGFSPEHAKDLLKSRYRRPDDTKWQFPKKLDVALEQDFYSPLPKIANVSESAHDGSVKFLMELDDGKQIETVLMPQNGRLTACLSTQVGCAQGCVFCHTGRMGLGRNLEAAEIVGQYLAARRWMWSQPDWQAETQRKQKFTVPNIVFMGMGEPLDNVENLIRSIRIFSDPFGLGLGMRKISVSTLSLIHI